MVLFRRSIVSSRLVDQIAIDDLPAKDSERRYQTRSYQRRVFLGITTLLAAGLVTYAVTMGFVWDEGFHLLAAQLVRDGKTPYVDFCFPQTLLNAYWNALLFKIFGSGWRVTHVFSALFLVGSAYLSADFVLKRFPVKNWRLPCALVILVSIALNEIIIKFGPIAQGYATGTFFSVAAFRAISASVSGRHWLRAFAAGLLAGIAAGCTLLTAPLTPVLFAWLLIYNSAGSRVKKAVAFIAGCAIPFAPEFWLFLKAPQQTFFNVVQYQALFRRVNWTGATEHDFDVFTAWLDSAPTFLFCGFALFAIFVALKRSDWPSARKSEFYLCGWLTAALTLYIGIAHPTFQRYFIFVVPFLSILGAVGFYAVSSRLGESWRPFWPTCFVCGLMVISAGKEVFDDRDSTTWKDYHDISKKIAQITPSGGLIYADEQVYFLLHRTPPSGMEFSYSHELELPVKQEALYHIISKKELNAQVKAGRFATVETCKDDRVEEMDLPNVFSKHAEIADCDIYWEMKASAAGAKKK